MFRKRKKKVFVGMSGGVDSSVATLLLKRRGFDVVGGFIRGYNVDGCQDEDLRDARSVAEHIDIPLHVFDFEKEYKERVVDYFLDGYRKGITPNPDVLCNSAIKFGLFYDAAMGAGADFVATGHYARKKGDLFGQKGIYQAKDLHKDQTYFLWQVPKERFDRSLFPLGKLLKKRVRVIAQQAHLPVAQKKDSQGVCFLGKFDFADFLKEHIPARKGRIVDTRGKEVGEHEGVWFYTIGQGHGFVNRAGRRFYVVKKDLERNELVVAYEGDQELYDLALSLRDLNFLDDAAERAYERADSVSVFARIRYRQPLEQATLVQKKDGVALLFQRATKLFPASGQSAVFYNARGKMLGGGIIQ